MASEPVLAATNAASIEVTPERRQPYKWLVAAAVLLGAILTILDGLIVNVALPYEGWISQLFRLCERRSCVSADHLAQAVDDP